MRRVRHALRVAVGALALVCGAGVGAASASADTGSVITLPPLPSPRAGAIAVALPNGRVLLAGGTDGSAPLASALLYDPRTKTWLPAAPMNTARAYAAAAVLPGGEVLVAGGAGSGNAVLSSAEIYDEATNSWSPAAAMPTAVVFAAGTALPDRSALIAGGTASYGSVLDTSQLYDPSDGTWTTGSGAGFSADGAAAIPLDGGALVVGTCEGYSCASYFGPDGESGTEQGGTLALPFGLAGGSVGSDEAIFAGGGAVLGGETASTEIDQPLWNQWASGPSLEQPVTLAAAAPLPDGGLLVAGGFTSDGTATASVQELTASVEDSGQALIDPRIDNPGEWEGNAVYSTATLQADPSLPVFGSPSVSITWQACATSCVDVGSGSSFTPSGSDIGSRIRYLATVSDDGMSWSATSPETNPVASAGFRFESSSLGFGFPIPMADPVDIDRDGPAAMSASVDYRIVYTGVDGEPVGAPLEGTVSFPPNAWQEPVPMPTQDHGVPLLAGGATVTLSDPVGDVLASPSTLAVTFSDAQDDTWTRDPANPLALRRTPGGEDPLRGASLFIDPDSTAARVSATLRGSQPADASLIERIADQPGTARFGAWDGNYPGTAVATYLNRAAREHPGAIPLLATYRIVDGQCHHGDDTPADAARYHTWITNLAEGIGAHPAVLFLEMDSIITTPCLSHAGLEIRLAELRDAVSILANCPHLVVYLDAGAADALSVKRAASLLKRADVADTQGFFLNSTHFDWTKREIAYGEKISRHTGSKHFVINTAENGQGPLVPKHRDKHGNEVLCNPPGRGLGPPPTTDTHHRHVDAFAWIANPGASGGRCRPGAPGTGVFWPALAVSLASRADPAVR